MTPRRSFVRLKRFRPGFFFGPVCCIANTRNCTLGFVPGVRGCGGRVLECVSRLRSVWPKLTRVENARGGWVGIH